MDFGEAAAYVEFLFLDIANNVCSARKDVYFLAYIKSHKQVTEVRTFIF